MKRLPYINFFGVLALALLCVVQWRRDRDLNTEVNRLEKARLDQASKLTEQERTVRGLNADLAQFKQQFAKAGIELNDTRQKLNAVEREAHQLKGERDQLRTSVTNWANAVTTRDERLKEATARIQHLADELNTSVGKFNELATNHNQLVGELNQLRQQTKPAN